MFKRLLVPLDGSKMAESAIPWSLLIAEKAGSKVLLTHILEKSPPSTIHGEPHIKDLKSAEHYLEELRKRFPPYIEVDIHVHAVPAGNVAASIADHVNEMGADLIILTSHGRQGIRGLILGSIGQQVLRATYAPVLLLKADGVKRDVPKVNCILLPLDGTKQSEKAIPIASNMAEMLEARLLLLLVVPTIGTVRGDQAATARILPLATSAVLELEKDEATQYLEDVRAGLPEKIDANFKVLRGDPVEVVTQEAMRPDVGLVVMASHGHPGLSAIWSASVGSNVQYRIDKPMLLVRP